jgi:hypothetical protein
VILCGAACEKSIGRQALKDGRLVTVNVDKGVEMSSNLFDYFFPPKAPRVEEKDGIGGV